MEQRRIYEAAREVLKEIEDEPNNRLTIREQLFLSRFCLWSPEHGMQVIAAFGERELRELLTIAGAIRRRGGLKAIH